jgi:hypothetical protein
MKGKWEGDGQGMKRAVVQTAVRAIGCGKYLSYREGAGCGK